MNGQAYDKLTLVIPGSAGVPPAIGRKVLERPAAALGRRDARAPRVLDRDLSTQKESTSEFGGHSG